MQILPTGALVSFKFIPKCEFPLIGNASIRNKQTNVSTSLVKDSTISYYETKNGFECDITSTFLEGEYYELIIYDEDSVVAYKGEFFITDNPNFSFNNSNFNEYVEHDSGSNTFKSV